MKLLFADASQCDYTTLQYFFLLANEICFMDQPSFSFGTWGTVGYASRMRQFDTTDSLIKLTVYNVPNGHIDSLLVPPMLIGIMSGHFHDQDSSLTQKQKSTGLEHSGLSYFTKSTVIRQLIDLI